MFLETYSYLIFIKYSFYNLLKLTHIDSKYIYLLLYELNQLYNKCSSLFLIFYKNDFTSFISCN